MDEKTTRPNGGSMVVKNVNEKEINDDKIINGYGTAIFTAVEMIARDGKVIESDSVSSGSTDTTSSSANKGVKNDNETLIIGATMKVNVIEYLRMFASKLKDKYLSLKVKDKEKEKEKAEAEKEKNDKVEKKAPVRKKTTKTQTRTKEEGPDK